MAGNLRPTGPPGVESGVAAIHRRRLGRAVWLWVLFTKWQRAEEEFVAGGRVLRYRDLGNVLGVSERQVRRDLRRLRRTGHVEAESTGRGFRIRLRKGPLA